MRAGSFRSFTEEPQERELYILTEFFKMLGIPTRIHILLLLMKQDACVGDLAEQLGMTQSAVSHQLSLLKSNKLVNEKEDSAQNRLISLLYNHAGPLTSYVDTKFCEIFFSAPYSILTIFLFILRSPLYHSV